MSHGAISKNALPPPSNLHVGHKITFPIPIVYRVSNWLCHMEDYPIMEPPTLNLHVGHKIKFPILWV